MPADDALNRWRAVHLGVLADPGGQTWESSASRVVCANLAVEPTGPTVDDIRAALELALPTSEATTNPWVHPTTGSIEMLAQMPLILHFDADRRIDLPERELLGSRVAMSAVVEEFVWTIAGEDYADVIRTRSVGRVYDDRHPCFPDDCGYYLTSEPFPVAGSYDVTLDVVWSGRYQVDGGLWLELPGVIARFSDPVPITVREARGQLISGDGLFE